LAISREFCLIMGGSLSVENELGKGSAFTVRLPADPDMAEMVAAGMGGLAERQPIHA
jgi:signal transduction histidine kinase